MESVDKNNVSAKLEIENWHIPRPTLALGRGSLTSLGSTSTNSTHSARSGSLLLTAANLALIQPQTNDRPVNNHRKHQQQQENSKIEDNFQYYVSNNDRSSFGLVVVGDCGLSKGDLRGVKDPDSVSIASSTHFTVVNVNSRPNVRKRSFCRKHQLTVLVVSMSVLILGGIMAAILFMELRARKQQF